MSLYTRTCAGLLFPLHERLKGHTSVAVRRRLETSQWWPIERIQAEQAQRLRSYLQDIGNHVPHYRQLFHRLGFDPATTQGIQDLERLPLNGKPEMRAAGDALKADDHGPLTRYNTGGSSGEPLIFYMGKARKSHDVAAKWRATRWWDVDIGDPELVVWGSPIELGAQDRLKIWRDRIFRSHLLPAFDMSHANLDLFVSEIRSIRPTMLFGYPSSLSLIGQHALSRGIRLDQLGIRVAFVTSERLYDEQRASIEAAFGCKVANGYGARDAGFLAHECPHGSMHLSAEDIVVETVRADGSPCKAGEAGEIVVTHLATRDFPFVRYRTGDVGVLGTAPCACGRGLPTLQEVQGRTTDFVVSRDGTVMHGLALIYALRDIVGVARFRIEQHTQDHTTVQIVAGSGYDKASEARIIRDFTARLGQGVNIELQYLPEIANEASGKFRYVVSHVKPPTTTAATAR